MPARKTPRMNISIRTGHSPMTTYGSTALLRTELLSYLSRHRGETQLSWPDNCSWPSSSDQTAQGSLRVFGFENETEPVHIWVELRGPEMCMPPPTAVRNVFAHVCVLVLSDLVSDVASTTRELAAFLLCTTRLQRSARGTTSLFWNILNCYISSCGGNVGLRALILLLRAPNLTTFDAKVVSSDDARFIEECGNLLKPVAKLRVYGIHSLAKMIFSLMNLMPGVTDIDLTTSARSFAACLSGYGGGWPLLSTIRLEDPAFSRCSKYSGHIGTQYSPDLLYYDFAPHAPDGGSVG
ncbi:hypothetical protein B0H14DRAFT_2577051 [Mycena olivaceomarginata]|nr:hypothetical protein B0H14DRAFT_2577051 [Mycena olivaceomarginata]